MTGAMVQLLGHGYPSDPDVQHRHSMAVQEWEWLPGGSLTAADYGRQD
jgi:hypothetical protein